MSENSQESKQKKILNGSSSSLESEISKWLNQWHNRIAWQYSTIKTTLYVRKKIFFLQLFEGKLLYRKFLLPKVMNFFSFLFSYKIPRIKSNSNKNVDRMSNKISEVLSLNSCPADFFVCEWEGLICPSLVMKKKLSQCHQLVIWALDFNFNDI